ncbi:MAG: hypothetical protein MUE56_07150, partial [Ignavibacteria bacterium]|nr:hypothetical protein [Ignavibacteria bacterium]
MENIIFFNKNLKKVDKKVLKKVGIRGKRALELAMMGLPIAPGFIIDSEMTKKLPQVNIKQSIQSYITQLEKELGKGFGDPKKPLLLKAVLSSDLNIPHFPSIHNIGLNDTTVEGFSKFTSSKFAYGEYNFLLKNTGTKIYKLDHKDFIDIEKKYLKQNTPQEMKKVVQSAKKYLGDKFSDDVYNQLALILKGAADQYCDSDIDVDNSLSIMIQVMVYGNFGQNSYSGRFYSRDIVTGDPKITGNFLKNAFDRDKDKPSDISKIDKKYYTVFSDIGKKVEENFK